MSKIFVLSDTHFGHRKMELYCGRPPNFEELIFFELMKIPYEDTLIHMGDVAFGNRGAEIAKWILPLPVHLKILITGNHDWESNNWFLEHGFDFVCQGVRMNVGGKKVLISHFPEKYDGWFELNLHGHLHNKDYKNMDTEYQKMLNDGRHKLFALEFTDYKPVLLEEFIKL